MTTRLTNYLLAFLLLSFAGAELNAQCVPLAPSTVSGFYPNPVPDGCTNQGYDEDIQFVFPLDTMVSIPPFGTFTIPFDSFRVDSVVNVPTGVTLMINSPSNMYYPVSATVPAFGCGDVFGTPTTATLPGSVVTIYLTAWLTAPIVGVQTGQTFIDLGFDVYQSPTAAFTASTAVNTATFTNTTINQTAYYWDFGDGSPIDSTNFNPVHTYAGPGNYNVCLIATNGGCADTLCSVVTTGCPAPAVLWSETVNGLTVNFTDLTLGNPISWLWDFGDGNTSTVQNPSHTYATAGTYTVCLTLTDSCGTDSTCATVSPCFAPAAAFTSTNVGNIFTFINSSTNGTTYSWDFGDGNTSTLLSPSHTFTAAGTYVVCLTTSSATCGSSTFCDTITSCAAPLASFTFTQNGNVATFTDASTGGATSWAWDFGDGTTDATQNPTHTYAGAGSYWVCLVATNACGLDSFCDSLDVLAGISAIEGMEGLQLFPNPVQDQVQIEFDLAQSEEMKIELIDIMGRIVMTKDIRMNAGHNQTTLNLSNLSAGAWILRISTDTGAVHRRILKD